MAERTEEEVVAGLLRIEVGDAVKVIPTLKARYVGEWMQRFAPAAGASTKPLGEWSDADVLALPSGNVDKLIDLMVAYDRTGGLGGREWLAENADPTQLKRAVEQMLENAAPFADAPALLALMLIRAAARSGQPNATNSPSTSGASTRTRSGRASTKSS